MSVLATDSCSSTPPRTAAGFGGLDLLFFAFAICLPK
jgi:hypothetical protein